MIRLIAFWRSGREIRPLAPPSGQVVTLDEFIPEDERHQSEYFQQFLSPINVHHILGADIYTPDGAKCSLRISRGTEDKGFDQDDKGIIETLIPHLKRSVQLHMQLNRMEAERNLYAGAVDPLAVGTIILDEEGKVLEINQVAKELENEDDGLRVNNRALQIGTQQDTRQFRELIKETLDEASETLFISRNTARAHLRSLFSKTGVTRQTMLVRLILKSVAPLG